MTSRSAAWPGLKGLASAQGGGTGNSGVDPQQGSVRHGNGWGGGKVSVIGVGATVTWKWKTDPAPNASPLAFTVMAVVPL